MRGWQIKEKRDPALALAGLYQLNFMDAGATTNEFSSHNPNRDSDEVPAIVPFNSKIIGLTYSFGDRSAETNMQLFRAANTSTNNSGSIIYSLALTNVRSGASAMSVNVNRGDKLALYFQDTGGNVTNPIVIFYLVPSEFVFNTFTNNLNSDFEN